jgi:Domain of Unknown Function (DUF349)
MLQEINIDLTAWWNEQSFAGKELFTISETGALTLQETHFLKERVISYLTNDNADETLKNLQDKFFGVLAKWHELETDWNAAAEKTKMGDKLESFKNLLQHAQAVGDFGAIIQKVIAYEQVIEAVWAENYNAKLLLAEQAESIASSENWKETTQAFKDIAEKWKKFGVNYHEKYKDDKLWKRIEAAKNKFYDKKKQHFEDEEKEMLQNLDLKIEIVEQAEALANSEDWKKTTEILHGLMDKWKETGRTMNKKNEELWQRFQVARNNFFDRKKLHSQKIQEEQEVSLQQKLAIIEKAESLKERTDWTVTAKEFDALLDEWKKTGKVPPEKSEELWKRYSEAHDYFFDAKRKHSDSVRKEHQANYELKMELLNRAEEIKNSNNWFDATQEMNELLDSWKKIGPVSREHSNEIWEAFIGARKHFFDRKDANREQRKKNTEHKNIVRAKQVKELEVALVQQIKDEEENLKDFKISIENITPGKKAEQLRKHLEQLIVETTQKLEQLKQKQAAQSGEKTEHHAEHKGSKH